MWITSVFLCPLVAGGSRRAQQKSTQAVPNPGANPMKLTASAISRLALPPGIDDKIYFDEDLPGFGVRLRRSGDRS